MEDQSQYTIVLALTGNRFFIEDQLFNFLKSLKSHNQKTKLIIVCDGPYWKSSPILQNIESDAHVCVIALDTYQDHFGALFNAALPLITSPFVLFSWPGVEIQFDAVLNTAQTLSNNSELCAITTVPTHPISLPSEIVQHGWCQYDNYFSLPNTLWRTQAIQTVQGFSTNPQLQRYIDWDIFIKISKYNKIKIQSNPLSKTLFSLLFFPFKTHQICSKTDAQQIILNAFVKNSHSSSNKIRATIVGGLWEPTHSQLCFYNYFESNQGLKDFEWNTLLDLSAKPEDLINSDIVIFCRGRTAESLQLIQWCNQRNIPTLYMLDDNWLTISQDWIEYKDMFVPGNPNFDFFIACVEAANCTLVYSPILENHLKSYTKNIRRLNVNIALNHFNEEKKPRARYLAGYVGSMRKNPEAFDALIQFIQESPDWDLIVYGNGFPENIYTKVDQSRIRILPYEGYHGYAKTISAVQPEILIAPLDSTEFSKSKCPNKFLEITAANAVGIYSNLMPYSAVVQNNINGIMINESDTHNTTIWLEQLHLLAKQPDLRKKILTHAKNTILQEFEVNQRYNDFYQTIQDVIELKKQVQL